jgi:hypothetical protein
LVSITLVFRPQLDDSLGESDTFRGIRDTWQAIKQMHQIRQRLLGDICDRHPIEPVQSPNLCQPVPPLYAYGFSVAVVGLVEQLSII